MGSRHGKGWAAPYAYIFSLCFQLCEYPRSPPLSLRQSTCWLLAPLPKLMKLRTPEYRMRWILSADIDSGYPHTRCSWRLKRSAVSALHRCHKARARSSKIRLHQDRVRISTIIYRCHRISWHSTIYRCWGGEEITTDGSRTQVLQILASRFCPRLCVLLQEEERTNALMTTNESLKLCWPVVKFCWN